MESEKYLSFRFGDRHFALPSSSVAEIVQPLAFTLLPEMPPWLLGLSNFRGEIAAVLDPAVIFNGTDSAMPASKSKFVILRADAGGLPTALPVDDLSGVLNVSSDEIGPAEGFDGAAVTGQVSRGNDRVFLLDASRLLPPTAVHPRFAN